MLKRRDGATVVDMGQGIERRTLNYGERTLLAELIMLKGSVIESHSHPHEQIGYLAKGRMLFEIGDEKAEIGAGDSWLVPGDVVHRVTALEDCIAIDIFSPVREEYK